MICSAVTVGYLSSRDLVKVLMSSGMSMFSAAIKSAGWNVSPLVLLPPKSRVMLDGYREHSLNCFRGTPRMLDGMRPRDRKAEVYLSKD
jgi:hypothetical protein